MQYDRDGFWSLRPDDQTVGTVLQYRYEFRDRDGKRRREPAYRRVEVIGLEQAIWDHFLAPEFPDGAFLR